MAETYIAIMLQSLGKKLEVLDQIVRLDDEQKEQLTSDDCPVGQFDKVVDQKSALIEQIERLDSGFEKLYAQVEEELLGNRQAYEAEIEKMQDLIRRITDRSVLIQAQEARNKELMSQKLTGVRKHAKSVRLNSKAITGYYKTINRTRYMDPQFVETKR